MCQRRSRVELRAVHVKPVTVRRSRAWLLVHVYEISSSSSCEIVGSAVVLGQAHDARRGRDGRRSTLGDSGHPAKFADRATAAGAALRRTNDAPEHAADI